MSNYLFLKACFPAKGAVPYSVFLSTALHCLYQVLHYAFRWRDTLAHVSSLMINVLRTSLGCDGCLPWPTNLIMTRLMTVPHAIPTLKNEETTLSINR